MNQQIPKVVEQVKEILPELAWPVKEVTAATFKQSSGLVNRSYGCYTTKRGAELKGAWVGLIEHQKLERGVYATISSPPEEMLRKVIHNGYKLATFGPHPFIKKLISEKDLIALRKKSGPAGVARKLKALLKKTYPFKKFK